MKRFLHYLPAAATLCAMLAAMPLFTACDDDDDPAPLPEQPQVHADQLADFAENIYRTDAEGLLTERINGLPLPELEADTTVLYIGVTTADTAKTIFKNWLPADGNIVENGMTVIFTPTDTLGQACGTITFTPASDADGRLLARVTFAGGAALKYAREIRFITTEAFPRNDESAYKVGDVVVDETRTDLAGHTEDIRYLCVRKAQSGQSGLLIGFSGKKETTALACLEYAANKADAREAAKIISANYNYFASAFSKRGDNRLKDEPGNYYYFDHYVYAVFYYGAYAINFKDKSEKYYNYGSTALYHVYSKTFGMRVR